jgi:hypothetical protein
MRFLLGESAWLLPPSTLPDWELLRLAFSLYQRLVQALPRSGFLEPSVREVRGLCLGLFLGLTSCRGVRPLQLYRMRRAWGGDLQRD